MLVEYRHLTKMSKHIFIKMCDNQFIINSEEE